jgi:hypothetical protein
LGAIIGDSEIRVERSEGPYRRMEDIKFSFDAEPAVSRWERACQGSVEIYVRFVEDGCEPFGRVLARL